MENQLRFESKYLLSTADYYRVRADVRCLCGLDSYSERVADNRYFVRSLYFDTDDFNAYVEKVSGVNERNKLRIRSYVKEKSFDTSLMVEQKIRVGRLIHKLKKAVSISEYECFLTTGSWENQSDPVLVDFERLVRAQQLSPKVIVDYRREAWTSKFIDGVRITFDHEIQYASASELFSEPKNFVSDFNKRVVMEIKSPQDDISWISELVRLHELTAIPNSKYVNAIDHSQAQIWH